MENYWRDLELFFPLKLLVELKQGRLEKEEFSYENFDCSGSPNGWNFWNFYFKEYFGTGVEITKIRGWVRKYEEVAKSWKTLNEFFSEFANKYKLNFPKLPKRKDYLLLNTEISKLNLGKNNPDHYRFWRFKLELSRNAESNLEVRLKSYLVKYLNNDLKSPLFLTFRVEKQIDFLRDYIKKQIEFINPKDLTIWEKKLVLSFWPRNSLATLSRVNKPFRLLEPLAALWFGKFIDVNSLGFSGSYDPDKPEIADFWFFANISLVRDVDSFDVDEIRLAFGIPISGTKIKHPKDRSYWYENNVFYIKLASGEVLAGDFNRSKDKKDVLRKIFEAFYKLYEADGKGEYTREEVKSKYKNLFNDEITNEKIGENVSNARSKILSRIMKTERLQWKFDRKKKVWIFKILPLSNPSSRDI